MKNNLVFLFYRRLLYPLAYLLLQALRPFLSGKLRETIEDRNQLWTTCPKKNEAEIRDLRPFWIHAASGEIEYAKPLIRRLKKLHPDVPVLVTFSSPSAKPLLEKMPDIDAWTATPWDLPGSVQKFLKRWNPRALFIARTDVWPTTAQVVASQKIPQVLFSATFAENSSRLQGWSGRLTAAALDSLTAIHCVSDADKENLNVLKISAPVYISGDTRFEQVFHRLENPKPLKNALMPAPEEFVFIAGSTWPEDERVILSALSRVQNLFIRTILAPHEVGDEHLEQLESQIQALGLKSVRYTATAEWGLDEILIIDRVGILAELYTWADVAFVGGSFKKQVHSVMEALAAGLPVLVGPYHHNNREALLFKNKTFALGTIVQEVKDPADVANSLLKMKNSHDRLLVSKEVIKTEVAENKFATEKILSSLQL